MPVTAFSTPGNPSWRWRIVNYAGETVASRTKGFRPSPRPWPGHEAPHRDERGRSLGARPASVDLLPPRSLKLRVTVFDNQIEAALKTLKKQMLKAGLFQEMKRRVAYEKSSVKRRRKQTAARKKRRKAMRRMERDSE